MAVDAGPVACVVDVEVDTDRNSSCAPGYNGINILEASAVSAVVFDIQHTRVRKFANLVIFAIGQEKHDFSTWLSELQCHKDGRIKVNAKTYETSIKNVFAGGDSVNGGKEVVNAVAEGREAAYHILKRFGLEVSFGRFNGKI